MNALPTPPPAPPTTATLPGTLLLGPPIEHRHSLQAMLAPHAARVDWVPDGHSFLRESPSTRGRLARALDPLLGNREPAYLEMLGRTIEHTRAELVLAYWGTLPLADILALRRRHPRLRIVLWLLCYPLSLTAGGVAKQRLLLGRAAAALDGVICPGPSMAARLAAGEFAGARARVLQVRPAWPASFLAGEHLPAFADQPNLIYVGRPDLSGATVHPADDVRPLLQQVLDAGIVLRHGQSREMDDGHPLRRMFAAVPVEQLTTLMSAHDASLIAYNLAACGRTDRFELTVPDRLLSTVAAGVPVALPAAGYAASREFLADYAPPLLFDSAVHLREQLADRERVQRLRERAWQCRTRYTAEAQAGPLREALRSVLG